MRRWIAVLVAVLMTGCGVGPEAMPTPVSLDEAAVAPLVAPSQPPGGTESEVVTLFFVLGERIRPVTRRVAAASVEDVLVALVSGPTDDEVADGLRSAIPAGTVALAGRVEGGVAHLDVTDEVTQVGGAEELLAVAQIVLTITGLAGVDAVTFSIDSAPVPLPRPDGALVARAVTAGDYRSLLEDG